MGPRHHHHRRAVSSQLAFQVALVCNEQDMSVSSLASYVIAKLSGTTPLEATGGDMTERSQRSASTPKLTAVWKSKSVLYESPNTNTSPFKEDGTLLKLLRCKSMPLLGMEESPPMRVTRASSPPSPRDLGVRESASRSASTSPQPRVTSRLINPRLNLNIQEGSFPEGNAMATPPSTPHDYPPTSHRKLGRSISDGHVWAMRRKQLRSVRDEFPSGTLPSVKKLKSKFDKKSEADPVNSDESLELVTLMEEQYKTPDIDDQVDRSSDMGSGQAREGRRLSRHESLRKWEEGFTERSSPSMYDLPLRSVKKLLIQFENASEEASPGRHVFHESPLSVPHVQEPKERSPDPLPTPGITVDRKVQSDSRPKVKSDVAIIRPRAKSEPDTSSFRRRSSQMVPVSVKKLKMQFEKHPPPDDALESTEASTRQVHVEHKMEVIQDQSTSHAGGTVVSKEENLTHNKGQGSSHHRLESSTVNDHIASRMQTPSVKNLRKQFEEATSAQSYNSKTAGRDVAKRSCTVMKVELRPPLEITLQDQEPETLPRNRPEYSAIRDAIPSNSVRNLLRQFESVTPGEAYSEDQQQKFSFEQKDLETLNDQTGEDGKREHSLTTSPYPDSTTQQRLTTSPSLDSIAHERLTTSPSLDSTVQQHLPTSSLESTTYQHLTTSPSTDSTAQQCLTTSPSFDSTTQQRQTTSSSLESTAHQHLPTSLSLDSTEPELEPHLDTRPDSMTEQCVSAVSASSSSSEEGMKMQEKKGNTSDGTTKDKERPKEVKNKETEDTNWKIAEYWSNRRGGMENQAQKGPAKRGQDKAQEKQEKGKEKQAEREQKKQVRANQDRQEHGWKTEAEPRKQEQLEKVEQEQRDEEKAEQKEKERMEEKRRDEEETEQAHMKANKAEREKAAKEEAEKERRKEEKQEILMKEKVKERMERETLEQEKPERERNGQETTRKKEQKQKEAEKTEKEGNKNVRTDPQRSKSEEIEKAQKIQRNEHEKDEQQEQNKKADQYETTEEHKGKKCEGGGQGKREVIDTSEGSSSESSDSKVGKLIDRFTNVRDFDFEEGHREAGGSNSLQVCNEDERRLSDVAALVGMFANINKKRGSLLPDAEEEEVEVAAADSKAKEAAPIPTVPTTKNIPGKVRTLRVDELRFFENDNMGESFFRSQSLRVKKTEPPTFAQPRYGSLREKKTKSISMDDDSENPTQSSKALPRNCRLLRPDEFRFFGMGSNNRYSIKEARKSKTKEKDKRGSGDSAKPSETQVFRLTSQGDQRAGSPGDERGNYLHYDADYDSENSILRYTDSDDMYDSDDMMIGDEPNELDITPRSQEDEFSYADVEEVLETPTLQRCDGMVNLIEAVECEEVSSTHFLVFSSRGQPDDITEEVGLETEKENESATSARENGADTDGQGRAGTHVDLLSLAEEHFYEHPDLERTSEDDGKDDRKEEKDYESESMQNDMTELVDNVLHEVRTVEMLNTWVVHRTEGVVDIENGTNIDLVWDTEANSLNLGKATENNSIGIGTQAKTSRSSGMKGVSETREEELFRDERRGEAREKGTTVAQKRYTTGQNVVSDVVSKSRGAIYTEETHPLSSKDKDMQMTTEVPPLLACEQSIWKQEAQPHPAESDIKKKEVPIDEARGEGREKKKETELEIMMFKEAENKMQENQDDRKTEDELEETMVRLTQAQDEKNKTEARQALGTFSASTADVPPGKKQRELTKDGEDNEEKEDTDDETDSDADLGLMDDALLEIDEEIQQEERMLLLNPQLYLEDPEVPMAPTVQYNPPDLLMSEATPLARMEDLVTLGCGEEEYEQRKGPKDGSEGARKEALYPERRGSGNRYGEGWGEKRTSSYPWQEKVGEEVCRESSDLLSEEEFLKLCFLAAGCSLVAYYISLCLPW